MSAPWSERPHVVQNLFNPAFCGLLLWEAIHGYNNSGMDFPLVYLVLPIVLHRAIRHSLPNNARTTLPAWIQRHPEHIVMLPSLVGEMAAFTSDGILWAARAEVVYISDLDARITSLIEPPGSDAVVDDKILEVSHCVQKARFLGKWLSKSGSTAIIFGLFGIRP